MSPATINDEDDWMRPLEPLKSRQGATQLEFTDVLTALILLGILLYLSYLQFPAYKPAAPAPEAPASGATRP